MLSRVADSLYWTSRYLERAEHTVRLLEVNDTMMLDPSRTTEEVRWLRVLRSLGCDTEMWKGNSADLLQTLTYDPKHPASVTACIAEARENARQVREEISSEQWMQLNKLYHLVTENTLRTQRVAPEDFRTEVLDGLHLFQGVTDNTMSHGEGWHFIQVGRSVERALSTVALLSVYDLGRTFAAGGHSESGPSVNEFPEWIGLLRCCIAFEAYCNMYTADLTETQILEFLLLNREFPHSVRYVADRLRDALLALEQESGRVAPQELMRVTGRLQASLQFVEIGDVLSAGVHTYLSRIAHDCREIHSLIYRDYIHYSVQTALSM